MTSGDYATTRSTICTFGLKTLHAKCRMAGCACACHKPAETAAEEAHDGE